MGACRQWDVPCEGRHGIIHGAYCEKYDGMFHGRPWDTRWNTATPMAYMCPMASGRPMGAHALHYGIHEYFYLGVGLFHSKYRLTMGFTMV